MNCIINLRGFFMVRITEGWHHMKFLEPSHYVSDSKCILCLYQYHFDCLTRLRLVYSASFDMNRTLEHSCKVCNLVLTVVVVLGDTRLAASLPSEPSSGSFRTVLYAMHPLATSIKLRPPHITQYPSSL